MSFHIGSYPLKRLHPNFPREPKDIDLVCPESWREENRFLPPKEGTEWHYLPDGLFYVAKEYLLLSTMEDFLYTWKLCHMPWNRNNWMKHAKDLVWMQDNLEVKRIEGLIEPMTKWWSEWFKDDKSRIDFDVPNEEFFMDNVTGRVLNHDDLHRFFMYGDEPMFTRVKFDKTRAAVEPELVKYLSDEDFTKLVREEVYTLMVEREKNPNKALYMSYVQKLITGLSPIWYAIEMLDRLHLFTKTCPLFEKGLQELRSFTPNP